MKLYHGTCGSKHIVNSILKKGIKPRGKRPGNWAERAPSHPDCVYLTDVYAGYFAICAAGEDRLGAVFEIDTDQLFEVDLLPDEDFMAHVAWNAGRRDLGKDLLETTAWYRERLPKYHDGDRWKLSLSNLGTCAHFGTIPPQAITRYVVFDLGKNTHLQFIIDPTITMINYKLLNGRYRLYTAHLFGDELVPPKGDFMCGPADVEMARFDRNDFRVVTL